MFTQFGRVPSVSDSFVWSNLRFEIVDMDGKRIDKVLVMSEQQILSGSSLNNAEVVPSSGQVADEKKMKS